MEGNYSLILVKLRNKQSCCDLVAVTGGGGSDRGQWQDRVPGCRHDGHLI